MSVPKRYFINRFSDTACVIPWQECVHWCQQWLQQVFQEQGVGSRDCDGGLYVGIAGVAHMCYYVAHQPAFSGQKQELLEKSAHYLKYALAYANQSRSKDDQTAFILGSAGTYAVAAALAQARSQHEECQKYLQCYASMAPKCLEGDFLGCGSDELLVGRAGYLSGILFLQKELGCQVVPQNDIFALCEATVKSGIEYSKKVKSPSPLMYAYYKTEYLGAAHGVSGILQMLLSFPEWLNRSTEAEKKIKDSVDFLLGLQTPKGNFPSAMDEVRRPRSEADELVHWCHGAPGVVYLMAKAYLRWKEEKYLQSCILCGELVWEKGLLKKGPGICHGVAGSGYVFLLLYRLTQDKKHLHRAIRFAQFIHSEEFKTAHTPDRPLSLYEGISGTLCFLVDLLQPEKAHFPFFDIF